MATAQHHYLEAQAPPLPSPVRAWAIIEPNHGINIQALWTLEKVADDHIRHRATHHRTDLTKLRVRIAADPDTDRIESPLPRTAPPTLHAWILIGDGPDNRISDILIYHDRDQAHDSLEASRPFNRHALRVLRVRVTPDPE